MSVSHPGLVAVFIVTLAVPVVIWVTGRISRTLASHDARQDQLERDLVTAAVDPHDAELDPLDLIEALLHDEVDLIQGVLDVRYAGGHPSPEQVRSLRLTHRRGLAARQRCDDEALDIEFAWLQGYGTCALMADLSEVDRAEFESDLAYRTAELRRSLALRRGQEDILLYQDTAPAR